MGVVASTIIIFYFYFPFSMPRAEGYFKSIGERKLQKDEIGQFNYVYETYGLMDITGDEFHEWDTVDQLLWRYGIAFASYGIPSIAIINEEYADRAGHAMWMMIKKMKSKRIWGDCIQYCMGDDPISKCNVMYKGHLNLMYGLYQLMTGNEEFAHEYTWLTNKIIEEITNQLG